MPAATLAWTCPIDGLVLLSVNLNFTSNTAADQAAHMHLPIDTTATCLGGHEWKIKADLVMERVS